jgi:NADPH:quinone reductase-like Zn-dependent oxidoreductase
MKAVQFAEFGAPHDVASCVDLPDLALAGDDDVLVDIAAFPINPADLLTISGSYAMRPPLPYVPGAEAVGHVREVGAGVDTIEPGDRVIMLSRENWAQQKLVQANQVIKVPKDVSVHQLAMLKVNPATALLMLENYVDLASGDWVMQDAANSGVGTCLIRLARARGIKTINIVRREDLEAPLKARGADVVLVDGPDLAERVSEATGGTGPKLAIDAIGGDICQRLADSLADGGTIVSYGMLSGEPCAISPNQIVFNSITLTGFWLAKEFGRRSVDDLTALYGRLADLIASGEINVDVEASYPIEQIREALAHAARPGRNGKIVVEADV